MIRIFLWLFAFIVVMGIIFYESNSDAMAICQESHSYDTCFNTLNN